jgi:hypothetical protein
MNLEYPACRSAYWSERGDVQKGLQTAVAPTNVTIMPSNFRWREARAFEIVLGYMRRLRGVGRKACQEHPLHLEVTAPCLVARGKEVICTCIKRRLNVEPVHLRKRLSSYPCPTFSFASRCLSKIVCTSISPNANCPASDSLISTWTTSDVAWESDYRHDGLGLLVRVVRDLFHPLLDTCFRDLIERQIDLGCLRSAVKG